MGSGDFGSNGSVHWRIKYDDDVDYADHVDIDAVAHEHIGVKKNHAGKFRVTARYNSVDEARLALKELQDRFAKHPSQALHLDVNARPKSDDPGPVHAWEVRVDW